MIEVHHALPEDSRLAQEIFRFRYRVFVEHAGWELPCRPPLEFDQFDTHAAVHLVSRAGNGRIAGVLRLLPTTTPYMIEQLWPELLGPSPAPRAADIWEVTRLGTDPELGVRERGQTVAELVGACLAYALDHDIRQMLAVMTEDHARKVVLGMGWSYERCGPIRHLGGAPVFALRLRPSPEALERVRGRTRDLHRASPPLSATRHQFTPALPA